MLIKTGPVFTAEVCHCTCCADFETQILGTSNDVGGGADSENKTRCADPFAPFAFVYSESVKILSGHQDGSLVAATAPKEKGGKFTRYYCAHCKTKVLIDAGSQMGIVIMFYTPRDLVFPVKSKTDSVFSFDSDRNFLNMLEIVDKTHETTGCINVASPESLGGQDLNSLHCVKYDDFRLRLPERMVCHIFVRSSTLSDKEKEALASYGGPDSNGSSNVKIVLADKEVMPKVGKGALIRRVMKVKMCGCCCGFGPVRMGEGK